MLADFCERDFYNLFYSILDNLFFVEAHYHTINNQSFAIIKRLDNDKNQIVNPALQLQSCPIKLQTLKTLI